MANTRRINKAGFGSSNITQRRELDLLAGQADQSNAASVANLALHGFTSAGIPTRSDAESELDAKRKQKKRIY